MSDDGEQWAQSPRREREANRSTDATTAEPGSGAYPPFPPTICADVVCMAWGAEDLGKQVLQTPSGADDLFPSSRGPDEFARGRD